MAAGAAAAAAVPASPTPEAPTPAIAVSKGAAAATAEILNIMIGCQTDYSNMSILGWAFAFL